MRSEKEKTDTSFTFSTWRAFRITLVIPVVSSEKGDVRSEKEKTDTGFSFSTWRAFRITLVILLLEVRR